MERWKAFESHYGPIPQPPASLSEMMAEIAAWTRWYALFARAPRSCWEGRGYG